VTVFLIPDSAIKVVNGQGPVCIGSVEKLRRKRRLAPLIRIARVVHSAGVGFPTVD
jgi:hypothetical protein